jgi:hypothetical protein
VSAVVTRCLLPCQDLVGKNLTYISQLDGLSFELYSSSVLPRLLEQVSWSGAQAVLQHMVNVNHCHVLQPCSPAACKI